MELVDGPVESDYAQTIGRYFLGLHRDTSWIVRRVETVHILDEDRVERRVTLDVDVASLRNRAIQCSCQDPSTVAVPLTLLKKNLLLDFDVLAKRGGPLQLVSSNQDSGAAQAMMLALIEEEGLAGDLEEDLRQKLFDIASAFPGTRRIELGDDADFAADILAVQPGDPISDQSALTWTTMFDNSSELLYMAIKLANDYMPITYLSSAENHDVIKFRYIDSAVRPFEPSFFGLRAAEFFVDAPSIGQSQREHFRIIAPEGTEIAKATLLFTGAVSDRSDAQLQGKEQFFVRTIPERSVLYTHGVTRGFHEVLFSLWPKSAGFLRPAMVTSFGSMVLLGLGVWAECSAGFLSSSLGSNLDAAVALLLVVPSLYSLYLARPGEHALKSLLLRRLRYLVFMTSMAHGAAAVSLISSPLITSSQLTGVWAAGSVLCLVTLFFLATFSVRNNMAMKSTRELSDHTVGPLEIQNR